MSVTRHEPVARPKNAAPWSKTPANIRLAIIIASVVPAAIALGYLFLSGSPFIVVLFTVFLPLQILGGSYAGYVAQGARGIFDGLLVVMTFFLGGFVLVMLSSVLISVVITGSEAMSPHFFLQNGKYVGPTTDLSYGGLGHSIVGTLLIVALTSAITVPLGIATAVYITETQGKSRGLVQTLLQAMAGLPSVVAGLFIFSMLIISGVTSYAGFAGSLALVPLMLPTVARVAEEALRLVPRELRNGALALGAPSWRAFFMVTLPAAKSGIVTAVLLGVARIVGETAPLLLTIFTSNSTNLNMFQGGMSALPSFLFLNLNEGTSGSTARAWGAALAIMIVVLILFASARFASRPASLAKQKKRNNK
jgi:phosphate transport system permease protein